ncbi:carboxylesterase [Simiduia curdlanivorans]|uniref:Alpha/beta hydrolase n=1 Tax=Simiduia curdlanivorans TaxID=1492769 RepID=A0ABV8UZI8_9GAMM|nr:carboxylesterase [Simiduia curdlanivorans]MDN3638079.1 carboxylesterase [Simiduia curdlanivorans]
MNYLPHITVETGEKPNAAVIWLHGLGASGHDFESLVPHLQLPASLAIRFIFPHAPEIPVTINGGYVMPAWYDILEMDFERKIDEAQIQRSSDAISALIEREISRGIPSQRIILAGFSQGGAVVYHCGLSFQQPLAGLLALSTYFATWRSVQVHASNAKIPVHLFHGSQDTVVPEAMGVEARRVLKEKGLKPNYNRYPMGHEVCLEEVQDISKVLQALLS